MAPSRYSLYFWRMNEWMNEQMNSFFIQFFCLIGHSSDVSFRIWWKSTNSNLRQVPMKQFFEVMWWEGHFRTSWFFSSEPKQNSTWFRYQIHQSTLKKVTQDQRETNEEGGKSFCRAWGIVPNAWYMLIHLILIASSSCPFASQVSSWSHSGLVILSEITLLANDSVRIMWAAQSDLNIFYWILSS
jgi:hypothetical protein